MRKWTPALAATLTALASVASAQGADADDFLEDSDARLVKFRAPNLSTELVNLSGLSRFHLTTRVTPGVPDDAVSNDLRWSFVPEAHIRIREGLTFDARIPFGFFAPSPGENNFVFGNLSLGVSGGGHVFLREPSPDHISPRLGIGGAFEILAPTAATSGSSRCVPALDVCEPVGTLRGLQAYSPEMFTEDAMFFRARAHLELIVSVFTAELELALSPGFTIVDDPDFLMVLGWAGRVSVKAGPYVEPYVELTNARHVAGENQVVRLNPDRTVDVIEGLDLSTSVQITIGLRGHFKAFDPALFVTIDANDGLFIFGLDLAGALRPSPKRRQDADDFFRGEADGDPWD